MGVFADQKYNMQQAFFNLMNPGVRIKTNLYLIAHSIYVNMHRRGAFMYKISFQESYHGRENRKTNVLMCKLANVPILSMSICCPASSIQYPVSSVMLIIN